MDRRVIDIRTLKAILATAASDLEKAGIESESVRARMIESGHVRETESSIELILGSIDNPLTMHYGTWSSVKSGELLQVRRGETILWDWRNQ